MKISLNWKNEKFLYKQEAFKKLSMRRLKLHYLIGSVVL